MRTVITFALVGLAGLLLGCDQPHEGLFQQPARIIAKGHDGGRPFFWVRWDNENVDRRYFVTEEDYANAHFNDPWPPVRPQPDPPATQPEPAVEPRAAATVFPATEEERVDGASPMYEWSDGHTGGLILCAGVLLLQILLQLLNTRRHRE